MQSVVCLFTASTTLIASGCSRETESATDTVDAPPALSQPRAILSFPETLRTKDQTVNDFVTHAMTTCANGDYDSFRLLWSAKEEPLTRQEYDRGWKAVRNVTVRALERVRLAPDPNLGETQPRTVYAVAAEVHFDPQQTMPRQEPERDVVLVLIQEHDEWRLGRAPKALRKWMADKCKNQNSESKSDTTG